MLEMLRSLVSRVCLLPLCWWDRLLDVWYRFDHGLLGVAVLPVVVLGMLGSVTRFAYVQHMEQRALIERHAELRCLAENVYHEGRGEPLKGQYAVAEVTMNRVASPRFPDGVCAVVHEKRMDPLRRRYVGAFSWTEIDVLPPGGPAWERALEVAATVYDERHEPVVPGALFYHTARVKPSWSKVKEPVTRIGNHIFYE